MNDLLPYANLTDAELLSRVYISAGMPALVLELAARLQHALDELSGGTPDLEDVLARHDKGALDGEDS
jgi:hypothetical protein